MRVLSLFVRFDFLLRFILIFGFDFLFFLIEFVVEMIDVASIFECIFLSQTASEFLDDLFDGWQDGFVVYGGWEFIGFSFDDFA